MICPSQVKSVVFPSRHARHSALASDERVKSGDTTETSLEDGRNGNWDRVLLEDGRCLQTLLVVGADGGRSKVREKAGFQTTGWDYKQHAVICAGKQGAQDSLAEISSNRSYCTPSHG